MSDATERWRHSVSSDRQQRHCFRLRSFVVAAGNAIRISELQHQLKENESQRTEITSYINQHSIQLHRWQLRLQTLEERKKELMSEILALS